MTLDALKVAQDSFASKNIKILSADKTNPGIPPSSLMAFMKKVQYVFQVYIDGKTIQICIRNLKEKVTLQRCVTFFNMSINVLISFKN